KIRFWRFPNFLKKVGIRPAHKTTLHSSGSRAQHWLKPLVLQSHSKIAASPQIPVYLPYSQSGSLCQNCVEKHEYGWQIIGERVDREPASTPWQTERVVKFYCHAVEHNGAD